MTITNSAIVRIGKYFQLREEAILVQDYFIKHHQWSKWQWYQYVLPNIGNHTKCWWFSSDLWSIWSKFFVTIIFAWHHIRCTDYQWYREFRVLWEIEWRSEEKEVKTDQINWNFLPNNGRFIIIPHLTSHCINTTNFPIFPVYWALRK